MILYFTGTGNSKYVADYLGDKLQDEVVSLNDMLKNDLPLVAESEKPFVWIAPIYAWRFPERVDELFRKIYFKGNTTFYFVATMGGDSGNCQKVCKKRVRDKGMSYGGFADVIMPDNYFGGFNIKNEQEMIDIVKAAHPVLDVIADTIKKGHILDIRVKSSAGGLKSGIVNYGFNKYMLQKAKYTVSEACTGCGKCVKVCPVNNIKMASGKPEFSDDCMGCYACIHKCPEKAINLGKRSEGKTRYVCIDYKKETI